MADQDEIEISKQLERITQKDGRTRFPVMSGTVKSVEGDQSCTVLLTVDDGMETEQVTLNVILDNAAGVYGVPAEGAHCLVAEVDGPGMWELLKASQYDKWYMKAGGKFIDITNSALLLNGDGFGGIPKVQETADKIKALEEDLNSLKQVFTVWTPVSNDGGAALKTAAATWLAQLIMPLTSKADLENSNVKHG